MAVMNRHVTNELLEQLRLGFTIISECRGTRLCNTFEGPVRPFPCTTLEIDYYQVPLVVQLIERGDEVQVYLWKPNMPPNLELPDVHQVIRRVGQIIESLVERWGRQAQWEAEHTLRGKRARAAVAELVQLRDLE
jgi:hypothetical protein